MDIIVQVSLWCALVVTIHAHQPDINECDDNSDGCSHNCNNTDGSYECSCNNGYVLDSDGKRCSG